MDVWDFGDSAGARVAAAYYQYKKELKKYTAAKKSAGYAYLVKTEDRDAAEEKFNEELEAFVNDCIDRREHLRAIDEEAD